MKKILIMLLLLLFVLACVASLAQVFPLPGGELLARETRGAPTAEARRLGESFVVCKNANVRLNPSATDRVLDWKLKGDRVLVLEWVNGWARIGDAMYINGWLLCPKEAYRE